MSAEIDDADRRRLAKRYEAIHNGIFVVETVYTILLLLAFLFLGSSDSLADFARSKSSNPWIYVAIYGAVVVVATKLLFLPLNFFGDFYLEHRFGLSNETFGAWALDELKTLGINLALSVVILDILYFFLRHRRAMVVGRRGVFLPAVRGGHVGAVSRADFAVVLQVAPAGE